MNKLKSKKRFGISFFYKKVVYGIFNEYQDKLNISINKLDLINYGTIPEYQNLKEKNTFIFRMGK